MIWLIAGLACESGSDTTDSGGSSCDTAPVLSWADVGEPLLLEYCDTCHASTTPDRQGAPEAVIFDTYEDVVSQRVRILAVLETDPPRMPPVMPIGDDDRDLLVSWLSCDVSAAD